jgi:hypothetical protein
MQIAGVPGFDVLLGGALFILQSPPEVTMIFSGNAEVRHIWLNASHSANAKPSWYGESVGHYEGKRRAPWVRLSPRSVE